MTANNVGVPMGDLLTMTLVHPADRGAQPWWRSAVLYEYAFVAGQCPELAVECVAEAVALGADGTVLPTGVDRLDPATAADIVAAHHRAGLRLIPSLAPSRGQDGMLADAELWLDAGADGIDLRSALAAKIVHNSGPFHALLARYGDDLLLAGAMRTTDDLPTQLAEQWLGHLRDDSLTDVPWQAAAIRAAVTGNFQLRDALGATPAWTTTYAMYRNGPAGQSWQADRMSPARVRATALMVMALPGAVYLLQGEEVGLRDWSLNQEPHERCRAVQRSHAEQHNNPASMVEHYRRSLHLRREFQLGSGTVAWVDSDAAAPGLLQLVNRRHLIILNTSTAAVTLPAEMSVEHASADMRRLADGRLVLPADTALMSHLPDFGTPAPENKGWHG